MSHTADLPNARPATLRFVGAGAIMLYFGDEMSEQANAGVQRAAANLERALGEALIDLVPSYTSLLVVFDPLDHSHTAMARRIRAALAQDSTAQTTAGKLVLLPAYYAPEAGADLETLARTSGLTTEEVISLHSAAEYRVYAIGFAPGFAYLGQVDERIARPRLETPRRQVPKGSVAIADRQTAVYPAASPGGWNLIGLCPTPMFDPCDNPPMPVDVGDRVRFTPIDRGEYLARGGQLA